MIGAAVTNADAVVDRLAALAVGAEAALTAEAALVVDQLRAAVDDNLSGGVLKARTGTLRASLAGGLGAAASVAGFVSASAPYAAFQEYGYAGVESVRAYLRRQTQAFGRPIKPVIAAVHAHSRRVDYPAHSYLRTALADMAPDISKHLSDAVAEVLQS